jgi:hypothetical protein
MLGDFFEKVSGPSAFDTSEYFFDKAPPPSGDEPYLFGWADELPPTFHGPGTSLPQQPITSQSYLGLNNNGTLAMEELPATSAEVLSGTPTFSRNGQLHQNEHETSISGDSMFPTREVANILMEVNNTPASGQQRSLGSFSTPTTAMPSEHRRTSSNPMVRRLPSNHLDYYSALNFPQPRTRTSIGSSEGLASKAKIDIRWGSDGNFLGNGYVPPHDEASMEEKEKEMLKKMQCLIPSKSSSAQNSCPSSPTGPKKQKIRRVSGGVADSSNHDEAVDDRGDSRPGKRRKCTSEGAEEEEDDDLQNPKAKKGGRRKNSSSDSSFKRRKSQSGNQKAIRENLTEEQKRSNHIMSEQKRRNLIKQGFDDLCELVPDLKGGGYSKSAVLLQSADWLENLLKGNESLRNILASLEGKA